MRDAFAGKRVLTHDEQALFARVSDILLDTPGIDTCGLTIEVEDTRVILRGRCASPGAINRVVRAVASLEDVTEVVDRMVVRSESSM